MSSLRHDYEYENKHKRLTLDWNFLFMAIGINKLSVCLPILCNMNVV